MSDYTKKQLAYMETVERNTPKGTNLSCGWHDAEHGITWDAYCDWAKDLIDDLEEGSDIGTFQPYKEWVQMKRDESPDRDNLGFSHECCDLCGSLPGDRYAVTALPYVGPDVDLGNYYSLGVCGDCLAYIANGDVPDDENL